ncbi:hypothetical protein B1C78_12495 [Thioalkalivibrio denitrificans]|uniref:Cytochrome C oxidase subunit I n=1 Tax=Thioalkalivibrio denitrificans TaxID=108003 RepID=A0A1V3NDI0_9GAMM|nr:hypothetical protein B1C78_12495 [Thioalkalivibrio denitrificans]
MGVAALAVAGLFAVLLVVARVPGASALFSDQNFFRIALVIHVDQSVLIWFLAFAGALWSLASPVHDRYPSLGWAAFALAAGGAGLMALSPLFGAGDPSLNNYVPVLRHPVFHASLILFGLGVMLQVLLYGAGWSPRRLWPDPVHVGIYTAGLATLASVASLAWTWQALDIPRNTEAYFEILFWGGGHVLQFAYTQVLLVAWIWLARQGGIRIPASDRLLSGLLILGVAPLLAVPLIHGAYSVESAEARIAFTQLMQYGNGLAAIPIGLLILVGLMRGRGPAPQFLPAADRALLASLLLFAVGGVLGFMIGDVNTIITAHYHGSIVGVTLAIMGLAYALLPTLGWAPATGRLARIQPVFYGVGQLLHIGGMAISGMLGIERKTASEAEEMDGMTQFFLGIWGLGGMLAVIGGILFVVVIAQSFLRRPR